MSAEPHCRREDRVLWGFLGSDGLGVAWGVAASSTSKAWAPASASTERTASAASSLISP